MKFIQVASELADRDPVIAPDFSGGGQWLNSEPLTIQALRGKVVVVDFWTYSCINCQRTLPYLRAWWEKYRDRGLVIVGVHTPEFEFEKDIDNLREATLKYGVTWPVVQDNDYRIWTAYSNHFWPHKYLVDRDGKIVYEHIGEGAYEETERRIQELLGISDMAVTEEPSSGSIQFGPSLTPELYMTSRGQASSHLGKGRDRVELLGNWETGEDFSTAGTGAKLRLVFQASEVNLVMSLPDVRARTVRVMVDDNAPTSLARIFWAASWIVASGPMTSTFRVMTFLISMACLPAIPRASRPVFPPALPTDLAPRRLRN